VDSATADRLDRRVRVELLGDTILAVRVHPADGRSLGREPGDTQLLAGLDDRLGHPDGRRGHQLVSVAARDRAWIGLGLLAGHLQLPFVGVV
jgi:hypothetical protein